MKRNTAIRQQDKEDNDMTEENRTYITHLKVTDCLLYTSSSYSADVSSYKKRNYYMVDHAEYLIGVFDNQKKLRSEMCIRDSFYT